MTQEEKELLIKDLCSRLPYNCMVSIAEGGIDGIKWADLTLNAYLFYQIMEEDAWEYVKPYLRPISDMTTEECERLFEILHIDENRGDWLKINDIGIIRLMTENGKDFYEIAQALYYLNSIHVDYNELIDKGLAKRASEGMYNN